MKGTPFTVRPLVLDIVRGYPAGASSTDVLAELQEQGVETTIDSVCHALSAATAAGDLRRVGDRGAYRYLLVEAPIIAVTVTRSVLDVLTSAGDPVEVLARWAAGRRRAR